MEQRKSLLRDRAKKFERAQDPDAIPLHRLLDRVFELDDSFMGKSEEELFEIVYGDEQQGQDMYRRALESFDDVNIRAFCIRRLSRIASQFRRLSDYRTKRGQT